MIVITQIGFDQIQMMSLSVTMTFAYNRHSGFLEILQVNGKTTADGNTTTNNYYWCES